MPPRALLLPIALLALLAPHLHAGNPITTSAGFGGVADPHVKYFDGLFYLYSTHDYSAADRGFISKDWRVFSSPDLVSWSLASTLLPAATPAARTDYNTCWATDAAQGADGSFFFYLSMGTSQIGVMRGPTPAGPWEDALGEPLVNASLGRALGTEARDPGVLVDDDGSAYLVFGTFTYYIARLRPDMVSFAEAPRKIVVTTADGGPPTSQNGVGVLDDKPYLHKRGSTYYFSFGAFYSTGSSPYGPFTQRDPTWVSPALIAPDFRINATSGPCWCQQGNYNDRHGSFFSAKGQDYWSSNDRSHSADPYNTNVFRDTVLTYVHYLANGSIAPVVIDATGVGAYSAAAGLQAESFFELAGAGRKWHSADARVLAVTGLQPGASALRYPRIAGAARVRAVVLRCALAAGSGGGGSGGGGALQLRLSAERSAVAGAQGSARALCAASLAALPRGGSGGEGEGDWREVQCSWAAPLGEAELHLRVEVLGAGAEGVLIDSLRFVQA